MCDGGQSVPIATLGGEFLSNFYVSFAPKANIDGHDRHVRFVPKADERAAANGAVIRSGIAPVAVELGKEALPTLSH